MATKIAIVGAGSVGGNLGVRLSRCGHSIRFGVRDILKAAELVARCEGRAEATSMHDAAAWAEVVIVALPLPAVRDVVRSLADVLEGKVVIDCVNSVARTPGGPLVAPVPEGSISAAIAQCAPGAKVVKAFNTFGAEFHLDPIVDGVGVDVFIASDAADAKKCVTEIATSGGFTPIDAGPLQNATLLESLAVLWINLAMRGLGRQIAFSLVRRS